MRLAAIYIEYHDYLINEEAPQTVNFGGYFNYSFKRVGKIIEVRRKLNPAFIEGFFDVTNIDIKLNNVNAIVGQNGAGKSSLLNVIRSVLSASQFGIPYNESLVLFEDEGQSLPRVMIKDIGGTLTLKLDKNDADYDKLNNHNLSQYQLLPERPQAIIYSPHFDLKHNSSYAYHDSFDISLDAIIDRDLLDYRKKVPVESNLDYPIKKELRFKNSLRQIEFLSSDLVEKRAVFKDLFHLPEHGDSLLVINSYLEEERYHNTPYLFRRVFRAIKEKIEDERQRWPSVRKLDKDSQVINQVEVNKYLLKRHCIASLIDLLVKKMESKNWHLEEGGVGTDEFELELVEKTAIDSLFWFVDNAKISKDGNGEKLFSSNSLKELFNALYGAIDKVEDEDHVTNETVRVSKNDAIEILNSQKNFLTEFFHYYYLLRTDKKDLLLEANDRIDGFINYEPFDRNLSSGESAMLNLFSILYDLVNSNLHKGNRFHEPCGHYIILLDEADLAFHPEWKRRYIKALVSSLPYFFEELETKPSIEIIITTHNPIALSDIPNSHVTYIERESYDVKPRVLTETDNRPQKTFGANITDLLADSFFMKDGLIGKFAEEKIYGTIDWLNDETNKDNAKYHRRVIAIIDEPIVQRKLAEMYDSKMKSDMEEQIIEDRIKKLQEELNRKKNK